MAKKRNQKKSLRTIDRIGSQGQSWNPQDVSPENLPMPEQIKSTALQTTTQIK